MRLRTIAQGAAVEKNTLIETGAIRSIVTKALTTLGTGIQPNLPAAGMPVKAVWEASDTNHRIVSYTQASYYPRKSTTVQAAGEPRATDEASR